jgi:hypothetical protein
LPLTPLGEGHRADVLRAARAAGVWSQEAL